MSTWAIVSPLFVMIIVHTSSIQACLVLQQEATKLDKAKAGPMEIDFSPLPGMNVATVYKIHLVVDAESGVRFRDTYTINRTPVGDVRDLAKLSIESVPGWKVRAVGDDRLVIEGHKDSGVRAIEIKVEGLSADMTPVSYRLPKEKK